LKPGEIAATSDGLVVAMHRKFISNFFYLDTRHANLVLVLCYNVAAVPNTGLWAMASLRTWVCPLRGPHTAHMYDSHPSNDAISASPLVVMATFTRRYFANIRQALQRTSCSFHSFNRLIRLVSPTNTQPLAPPASNTCIYTNPW